MMLRQVAAATSAPLLVLTFGCGTETTPLEAVPELEAALARVDDAVVDESYRQARAAARDLKQMVLAARESGELTNRQAEEIVAATVQLVQDLPKVSTPEPRDETTSSPTPTEESSTKPEEDKPEKVDDEKPKDEEKPEKEEKPKEEDLPGSSEDAPGHEDD